MPWPSRPASSSPNVPLTCKQRQVGNLLPIRCYVIICLHCCCCCRLVKHHQHAFQSDNVTDKLRIQIFQMSSNATSLVTKKDIPMFSIVCRESHFSGLPMADHQDAASGGNELLGSHHQDLVNQPYSSFTHGNSLNALMGLQTGSVTGTSSSGASGHASTTKQRPIDKTSTLSIFFFLSFVYVLQMEWNWSIYLYFVSVWFLHI